MDIATTILTSALFNGICSLIIYLSIKNTFEKELETHKDNLGRLTAQNNFRYSRVFNKTENVIATVYKMPWELKDASEGAGRASLKEHRESYLYWGTIATDKILDVLPFLRDNNSSEFQA